MNVLLHKITQNIDVNNTLFNTYYSLFLKITVQKDALELLQFITTRNEVNDLFDFSELIKKWADLPFLDYLYTTYIKNNILINIDDYLVLELLGYHKYVAIKPTLVYYIKNDPEDYYITKSAVVGLLNFDCSDIQPLLIKSIETTYHQGLFREYIPALAGKVSDNSVILDKLFETGNNHCSTNCNSGIILGLSLSGEKGRAYFFKAVLNPDWETYNFGIGNIYQVYQGLKNMHISFKELFTIVLQSTNLELAVKLLINLLEIRIDDLSNTHQESAEDLLNLYQSEQITDLIYEYTEDDLPSNCKSLTQKHALLIMQLQAMIKEELLLKMISTH